MLVDRMPVAPGGVGLPDLDQRALQRPAVALHHATRDPAVAVRDDVEVPDDRQGGDRPEDDDVAVQQRAAQHPTRASRPT
jgi:hypothetical protein